MNDDGTMNDLAGKYAGMDRFAARKAIVKDLEDIGRLLKIEKMIHSVGHSERTGVVVEPRLSTQWFVKMGPLAKEAIDNQSTDQAVEFSHRASIKLSCAGWKIFTTGLFPDNCGGDIKFLLGTTMKLVKCMWA